MSHWIRLDGDRLGFAAAHFATFAGDLEPLHGHNYRVIAEISGQLAADSWVFDFRRAREIILHVCSELDHRFLLQGGSSLITFRREAGQVVVEFGPRRYVMPEEDVAELPVDNTTAERLAEYFASRLAEGFGSDTETRLEAIRVGIEEGTGQSGWFSLSLR
jgi:6-pyruvoyltetrahydropterin/6-carboxytetrahydropterin synthase